MSKQASTIKLRGKVGDLVFFKTRYGYLARENAPVSPARIATDPAFQRTRENNAEFSTSCKSAKLLRKAINNMLKNVKDGSSSNRLQSTMMKVVKSDTTSARGQRKAALGEAQFLKGFEFNGKAAFDANISVKPELLIDRPTGKMQVKIPSFIPVNEVNMPEGATHFAIVSAGVELDFEQSVFTVQENSTGVLPWNNVATGDITLTNTVSAASANLLLQLVGVQYYQLVNGVNYPIKAGDFNSLTIMQVDQL